MTLEKNNSNRLEFKELNSSTINSIATEVLKPLEVIAPVARQELSKLLRLLNIEFNFNKTISDNQNLLFLRNEKIIGCVIVSNLIQGKEARIKFYLFENGIDEKEILESLKETIDQVFDMFHLQRIIFHLHKDVEYQQPEAMISNIYKLFPVGFLNAEEDTSEFVVINNQCNHKEEFYTL